MAVESRLRDAGISSAPRRCRFSAGDASWFDETPLCFVATEGALPACRQRMYEWVVPTAAA